MKKSAVYIRGWITLLIFPLPTLLVLHFWEGMTFSKILDLENIGVFQIGIGLQFGFVYALLSLLLLRSSVFEGLPMKIEGVIRSMKLSVWDSLFLSFCAGFGEELLFRTGFQFYIHPIITTIVFIAIHGYLNPFNWRISLYGLILMPFILLISYGYLTFGLWFAIAAHFMYDFVIFSSIKE